MLERLKEYRNETLAFLTSETDMEYENNLSERLLRACKRKSRAVISFRSADSVSAYCDESDQKRRAERRKYISVIEKGIHSSIREVNPSIPSEQ